MSAGSRVVLRGVAFDAVTEQQVVDRIVVAARGGAGGWVITPNLHFLVRAEGEPELRGLLARADLVIADGMPLIWASRLARTPLPERVAGSDLVSSLAHAAASAGLSVFLLGGEHGVAERAAAALVRSHPGLEVAGTHYPPLGFETDAHEFERLREALVRARPAIVFVGLGFPRQERVIERVRAELAATWFLGIGISLSFVSGDVRRAPAWMQHAGLEWLHRLGQEPRRLTRRYLREGLPFAARLLASSARAGARRRGRRHLSGRGR
jgi:N-acetylglucosaminyldiphosphoundecaprenol N-acetyl-beta-D-mannosaminyltransferase